MAFHLAKAAAAAAALIFLAAGPSAAQVPDPYARELAQQLTRADQLQSPYGYTRAAGPFAGGLSQNLTRRFPLMMRAGQPYRIVGVCDGRCRDLDLRLYDTYGNLISQDVLPDNVPMVQINPQITGTHTIEVIMAQCVASPCYFAFNVYSAD